MSLIPKLLNLATPDDYKNHFINKYCKSKIQTYDGIIVKFYAQQFEHSFYESSNKKKRNKDVFSLDRALRIDWIEYVLKNPKAELHLGWDRDTKKYNTNRRVAIISPENYVVVIRLYDDKKADFITAYYADNSATKIRNMPFWPK